MKGKKGLTEKQITSFSELKGKIINEAFDAESSNDVIFSFTDGTFAIITSERGWDEDSSALLSDYPLHIETYETSNNNDILKLGIVTESEISDVKEWTRLSNEKYALETQLKSLKQMQEQLINSEVILENLQASIKECETKLSKINI